MGSCARRHRPTAVLYESIDMRFVAGCGVSTMSVSFLSGPHLRAETEISLASRDTLQYMLPTPGEMEDFFDNWTVQVRKGILEYCILTALGGGEQYGYALVKRLCSTPRDQTLTGRVIRCPASRSAISAVGATSASQRL